MINKIKSFWPILVILLLAFLLRIYKLEELFYFTYDESIPAFVGRRLILWKHIPLIGGVTPFNFHLGPYFYWFYSAILFLGKLNPIAWGYASAIIAMATTFMIFVVGKVFSSKKIALTAAIFWAFSYLANVYDRHLWALYWGPLISLTVIYSLYKIVKGNQNFTYLLGAVLALAVHADPSNLIFVLLASVVWIFYKIPIKKSTLVALFLVIVSFAPIIVFDLTHNFANIKPFFEFWQRYERTL